MGFKPTKVATSSSNITKKEQRNICVRMQFMGEGKKETTYQDQLRKLLYENMQCVKEIDPSASLAPWKKDSRMKAINGNKIKLLKKKILKN